MRDLGSRLARALHGVYFCHVLALLVLPLLALVPMSFSPSPTIVAWPQIL